MSKEGKGLSIPCRKKNAFSGQFFTNIKKKINIFLFMVFWMGTQDSFCVFGIESSLGFFNVKNHCWYTLASQIAYCSKIRCRVDPKDKGNRFIICFKETCIRSDQNNRSPAFGARVLTANHVRRYMKKRI